MADKTPKAASADAPAANTVRIRWTPSTDLPRWVKQDYEDAESGLTFQHRAGAPAVLDVPAEHAERILALKSGTFRRVEEAE